MATAVAALLLLPVLAACTTAADELSPSLETLRALREQAVPAMSLGAFTPASPAIGRSVTIRLSTMRAPGGNGYAAFLGETFATELRAAGKLDPAAPLQLSGVLTESTAGEDMAKGHGALAARITLSRAGTVVFARDYRATAQWHSEFIGALAIPEALRQYNALHATLVRQVFADPDFVAATRR